MKKMKNNLLAMDFFLRLRCVAKQKQTKEKETEKKEEKKYRKMIYMDRLKMIWRILFFFFFCNIFVSLLFVHDFCYFETKRRKTLCAIFGFTESICFLEFGKKARK